MKKRTMRFGLLTLFLVSLISVLAFGQGDPPVAPLGLIIAPPENPELEVSVWVDKGAYALGEKLMIHYSVNKPAYIYIWDITPDGTIQPVFPHSGYPGGLDNYVSAGDHTVPFEFTVAPPLGTEYLQILATTTPVDPFAFIGDTPAQFQLSIEVQILGLLVETERSWASTSFEIVSGTPPSFGTVTIQSSPSGATIVVDGNYAGYTPKTMFIQEGLHQISISKAGYQSWSALVYIIGTRSRTINATLTPIAPPNASPNAAFSFSPSTPQVGQTVLFDGTSSTDSDGTIIQYTWNFGDGSTGTGPVIAKQYAAQGSYSVTLTVQDNDGATDTATRAVTVASPNALPVAAFTVDPTLPLVGTWVKFDGSASFDPDGAIASWNWNFGDGTTDAGQVAFQQFAAPGTYTVTLTVIDNKGASGTSTVQVSVQSANLSPAAVLTYTPAAPGVGEWIRFDAAGSSDPDGTIVSYVWTYGDGSPPVTTTARDYDYHQYAAPGSYTATLTVTDDDGATDSTSRQVDVGIVAQPPVASFTYSPLAPTVGQPISLNGQASTDPDGTIVSYSWDFDADGISDAAGPVGLVTFQNPGVATVRLTVTDNSGLTGSTTQSIVVSAVSGPVGAPAMGMIPGIFIWGTDTWHVTVNAGAGWTVPRAYRLELKTDGTFENVNQPSGGGVFPMGLIVTPEPGGNTLLFEGTLQSGAVDHTFTAPGASKIILSLELDIDGDGDLDESSTFVYLRHSMVHPPAPILPGNWDLTFGVPRGSSAELVPSIDFRIGYTQQGTASSFTLYTTSISALEGP